MDNLPVFRSTRGHVDGYQIIKEHFLRCEWFEMFDLLEWLIQDENTLLDEGAIQILNELLERENSAYRIVGKNVAEITDENEIKAIEDALESLNRRSRSN